MRATRGSRATGSVSNDDNGIIVFALQRHIVVGTSQAATAAPKITTAGTETISIETKIQGTED